MLKQLPTDPTTISVPSARAVGEDDTEPSAIRRFGPSRLPSPEYRREYASLWRTSSRYTYLGGNAFFSSFRVLRVVGRGLEHPPRLEIHVVDPSADDAVASTARLLNKSSDLFRLEAFMAIAALHDADVEQLTLYLGGKEIGFRCEHFDRGLLIAPYEGDHRYHETELHPAGSTAHAAFDDEMETRRRRATTTMELGMAATSSGTVRGDEALQATLRDLGCELDLEELRAIRDARFNDLWTEATAAFRQSVDYL